MPEGLDHLVIAAHDLDRTADLYRRMGFTVGARNRHAWGTLNHIVQFPGHFLELIALEPGFARTPPHLPVAQFANFLADYLGKREGLAMLVLESRDAAEDQAHFGAHGIAGPETFFFERRGRRPDGSEVHLAFTLAFARTPAIGDAGFFVSQQHYPENFWNPAFQEHANGVQAVSAVVMAAEEPAAHLAFLSRFVAGREAMAIAGGFAFDTGRGMLEIVRPDRLAQAFGESGAAQSRGPRFAATRFSVGDLAVLRAQLELGGVAFAERDGRVIVSADAAHGVALGFEAE